MFPENGLPLPTHGMAPQPQLWHLSERGMVNRILVTRFVKVDNLERG